MIQKTGPRKDSKLSQNFLDIVRYNAEKRAMNLQNPYMVINTFFDLER